ncbi:ATP-grasp domain-containing protein [Butyrivibrio fibrisolvens]|uniref:ATP-grasp domain-containing protein n=1 Tax=Butyrivibrio fibrisolvens TaxID=831 RepID=UPI000423FD37|nr:ATP-grasp domain-containing protein [Butyrivibrio fibrisolvens]
MNILVLSAGTRDKVVEFFKKEIGNDGRIIATDCSNIAPAIYEADKAYIVPPISAQGYIDKVVDICKKENITGCFSLIDPELSLIAKEKEKLEAVGCTPVVSSYDLCETCLDKYKMFELLQGQKNTWGDRSDEKLFRAARCYRSVDEFQMAREKGEVDYPVFVKPQNGSASININKISTDEELNTLFDIYDGLMIQEFMKGQEYGADVYIDMISGKCTAIFLKKKIKMRAGETDKSVSVKDEDLFKRIAKFVENCGFRGMIDIDLFKDDDDWYLSEINPRFGGGYPHAYMCGVNMPGYVINNLKGIENPVNIGNYEEGIYMMKYNELKIMKEDDLVE